MAVTRVFGTVDGADVVLQHSQGDVWQVPVPLDMDGEYVVEIIAEDEAGNRSYLAKQLFIVNTALLSVRIIPLPYYAVLMETGTRLLLQAPSYQLIAMEANYEPPGGRQDAKN